MQAMTIEEKAKFEKMESSVEQIQVDVSMIKSALLGNDLAGDKGLVGQIATLKAEHVILKAELKLLSDERVKNTVYVSIIRWLLGVICAGAIAVIFKYFK